MNEATYDKALDLMIAKLVRSLASSTTKDAGTSRFVSQEIMATAKRLLDVRVRKAAK